MQYFLDNQFVSQESAFVHVHDLGLLRGYGVYECFRCYEKTPFYLKEHLSRFFSSCKNQNLKVPYTNAELVNIIDELIKRNKIDNLVFKVFLTAGSSDDHISYQESPRLIIICHPFQELDKAYYDSGYKVKRITFERQNPTIKTTAYATAIQSVFAAKKQGFDDCMYVDCDDNVLELTTSNLFFIKNNTLITPSEKILFGMTRLVTLNIAKQIGLNVDQVKIPYDQINTFDEVFCTSTLKKILPIQKIDNTLFPIGPITQTIMHLFDNMTQNKAAVCL